MPQTRMEQLASISSRSMVLPIAVMILVSYFVADKVIFMTQQNQHPREILAVNITDYDEDASAAEYIVLQHNKGVQKFSDFESDRIVDMISEPRAKYGWDIVYRKTTEEKSRLSQEYAQELYEEVLKLHIPTSPLRSQVDSL